MKEKIIEIVNNILGGGEITEKDVCKDLSEYGLDSLSLIRVVVALEAEFNCQIPDSKLLFIHMNTVEKISSIITEVIEAQ